MNKEQQPPKDLEPGEFGDTQTTNKPGPGESKTEPPPYVSEGSLSEKTTNTLHVCDIIELV